MVDKNPMEMLQIHQLYQQLRKNGVGNNAETIRDLTRIKLTDEFSLIVAVDSDGGIGSLEGDTIKCDPYQLGRFAMRVPLLELLSCGAKPLAAFDMLTIPMKGPGEEIVRGVRDELMLAGLDEDFPLSGSTEDNVPTIMTGIGTTVIGIVHSADFRPGLTNSGDILLCIGLPKSAPEDTVLLDDDDIVNQGDILKLLKVEGVHEILPVGSKGISHEACELARMASIDFIPDDNCPIRLDKSGGPSTCVIVSCKNRAYQNISNVTDVPITKIGRFT